MIMIMKIVASVGVVSGSNSNNFNKGNNINKSNNNNNNGVTELQGARIL